MALLQILAALTCKLAHNRGLWERDGVFPPWNRRASIVSYLDTSTIIWASFFEIRLTFFKYANHLIWRKKPIWNKVLSFLFSPQPAEILKYYQFLVGVFCLRCPWSTVSFSSVFSVRCKERSALSVTVIYDQTVLLALCGWYKRHTHRNICKQYMLECNGFLLYACRITLICNKRLWFIFSCNEKQDHRFHT